MDAIGAQPEILRLIRQKKANYVVTLKRNHPQLYHQVKNGFETARANQFNGFNVSYDGRKRGIIRLKPEKYGQFQ